MQNGAQRIHEEWEPRSCREASEPGLRCQPPADLEPWEETGNRVRCILSNRCSLAAEAGGDQGREAGCSGQTSGGVGWPNVEGDKKHLRSHPMKFGTKLDVSGEGESGIQDATADVDGQWLTTEAGHAGRDQVWGR